MGRIKGGFKGRLLQSAALCLFAGLMIFNSACNTASTVTQETVEHPEIPREIDWKANWIWGDFEEDDSWLMARKTFSLEETPGECEAIAYIAADSKYWLYVNGKPVIRDGEMKRGQTLTSTYYDIVDLSPYLAEGENCLAFRVWYWGNRVNNSYISSGQGGLCVQIELKNETLLVSDDSWMVRRDVAFSNEHNLANYRLPETDIWYDASKEVGEWTATAYEEKSSDGWGSARTFGKAGDDPWGEMIARTIPQFKDAEEHSYINAARQKWSKEEAYTTKSEEVFSMELLYNAQVYPVLEVEAPEGLEISIKSDFYEDNNGDSVMTTYITKEGYQRFETPGWMNGEEISYDIPAGVTVKNLSYVETGYDTEFTGSFSCDDEFYNELWEKSVRTVYVNMRDTYMDCPNRERAGWAADAVVDMNVSMYSMDPKAYDMFKSMVYTLIGNGRDGYYLCTNPCTPEVPVMTIQNQILMLYPAIMEYYAYTGDKEFIADIYEPLAGYLNTWQPNEDGIYDYTRVIPRWDWGDSTENVDYYPIENCWVYSAFDSLRQMAKILEKEEDATYYARKQDALKVDFKKAYWTKEGFKSEGQKIPDERANALAVYCGIAEPEQYNTIAGILENQYHSTPLLEYYEEAACCIMGRSDLALDRMKKRYDCMINASIGEETTTLWEYFAYGQGTQNHGWAAGPLVILSKYIAGIEPATPGYEVCRIVPDMGDLNELHVTTDTVKGTISLDATYPDDSGYALEIACENEMELIVGVEKMSENPKVKLNHRTIYKNGDAKDRKNVTFEGEDDTYLYFRITGTKLSIESE